MLVSMTLQLKSDELMAVMKMLSLLLLLLMVGMLLECSRRNKAMRCDAGESAKRGGEIA